MERELIIIILLEIHIYLRIEGSCVQHLQHRDYISVKNS